MGDAKEKYELAKQISSDLAEALSLVFPSFSEWVASRRIEILISTFKKVQEKLDASGLPKEQIQYCSAKLGIPLLENASLEEDPLIQDLWANLLTNALLPGKKNDRYHYFVSILKKISPLEAELLSYLSRPIRVEGEHKLNSNLYLDPNNRIRHRSDNSLLRLSNMKNVNLQIESPNGQTTSVALPKKVDPNNSVLWNFFSKHIGASLEDMQISVDILENLGLISAIREETNILSEKKHQLLARSKIQLTPLGFAFVSACIDDAGGGIEQSSMQEGS